MLYGVHGFAPAGSGSSPRWAIQMRSGVSAYTAPTDPHVQPSCFTPSSPSGSGCGQFATSSYGPNSSCPPFSCAAAAAAGWVVAFAAVVDGDPQAASIASPRKPSIDSMMNDLVRTRMVTLLPRLTIPPQGNRVYPEWVRR